jgi:serine protease Do
MTRTATGLSLVLVAIVSGLLGLAVGGGRIGRSATATAGAAAWPSFADVVARVNPAVVHIAVAEGAPDLNTELGRLPGWDGPRRGEGSGFVIDPTGYVVTNQHVVANSSRIRVRFADKRDLPARLVGADPNTDLALLKVDGASLPSIPLGKSSALRVGDPVCAIGNPYRFDHSVTVGVVSSLSRKIWDASFDAYIQTDAAINPGNSGGPLLNAAGEVIGINSAMIASGQGIGFAIPIDVAADVIDQLKNRGRVSRGFLGISLQAMEPGLQKLVGLSESKGAIVLDVLPGSAGAAAGLRRYDVITGVSGERVDDDDKLVRLIAARPPGSAVTLAVFREGRPLSLEARLDERAQESPAGADHPEPAGKQGRAGDVLGLEVVSLGATMRGELGIPAGREGVVVKDVLTLAPGGEALNHGDIVVEVNRKRTPDMHAYEHVLSGLRPGDVAWLYVYRPRPSESFLVRLDVEPQ